MKNKMIVLIGGPGVGKGTIGKMLDVAYVLQYIETGEMLRSAPADSEIAKIIATGNLVPDAELFKLVQTTICDTCDVLLDGFPRTLAQAQWLVKTYADIFDIHILFLSAPDEIIRARLDKRFREGSHRADDGDVAVVERRLKTFTELTMPAVKWLRTAPEIRFSQIDASGTIEQNYRDIIGALGL